MENQHRLIKTYRELNETEIALINRIKDHGAAMNLLVQEVRAYLAEQSNVTDPDELLRIQSAEPHRWASIGRTHFQEGLMALTRAVAQPDGF